MAAGFSAFKQHFARGQAFSYDLADIGRYYRDYVRADGATSTRACPAGSTGSIYEDVVDDTEGEVRRLLDHCGLPFEASLPALPRKRPRRAHRQLRTGAPADLPRGAGPVAQLRALAGALAGGARTG